MQLKLADYGENKEKFERFLELHIAGEWKYLGNAIEVWNQSLADGQRNLGANEFCINGWETFYLDEKDPLNRFNGLFNGRTFGNGRFVLIENRDFIKQVELIYDNGDHFITYETGKSIFDGRKNRIEILQGNLHQNPELWEEVK